MLKLIGYWRDDAHPELPVPVEHIDAEWDEDERDLVAQYFSAGTVARTFMGFSLCRVCGIANGAMEFTDGEYAWPDGLAHYISDHGVRLPSVVVAHALRMMDKIEAAEFDLTMWRSATQPID